MTNSNDIANVGSGIVDCSTPCALAQISACNHSLAWKIGFGSRPETRRISVIFRITRSFTRTRLSSTLQLNRRTES